VLYAASTRLCCFLETLARFRPAPAIVFDQLNQIENADDDFTPPGKVPQSWLAKRQIGQATLDSHLQFADIYTAQWLFVLRTKLERTAERLGFIKPQEDFDLSTLLAQHRRLTQQAATLIYSQGYDGIYYHSRYGTNLESWALFEREEDEFGIRWQKEPEEITETDPDFNEALKMLNLEIDLSR
jgi:RES domain